MGGKLFLHTVSDAYICIFYANIVQFYILHYKYFLFVAKNGYNLCLILAADNNLFTLYIVRIFASTTKIVCTHRNNHLRYAILRLYYIMVGIWRLVF